MSGSGRAIRMCTILASIRDRITVILPIGVRFLLAHWYSSRCILSIFFFRFIFVICFRSVVNSTPSTVNFSGFHSMLTSCRTMFSGGLTHPNHIHLVLSRFIFNPEKVLNLSRTEKHFWRASLEPSKNREVSSANWLTFISISFREYPLISGSFLIMWASISLDSRNKYGDMGSPCRQPLPTGNHDEIMPFIWTHDFMSEVKSFIHCLKGSPKLKSTKQAFIYCQQIESNYTLYTTPLGKIIKEHNINYHMYADDTQLYKSVPFSDLQLLVQSIETCSVNVKKWMTDNKLKMNNEKTEILLCGPKKYVESSDCDHICIEGENISFSDNARNLGVYFDCTFSMEHHVKQLCKSLFFELRKISHMRAFLNEASLQKLVTSFVLSRMDYCNSLLINLPNDTITKLQRIQNHAARLVLKKAKRDHVTPLFRKLHWLPLQARIDYKICVLCFKCINKTAPSYLSDLLEQYVPSRLLRSGSQNLLKIPPRANKKCTEKAFKHCAPYIWNSLPSDIREAKSESQFKNDLKTHLFKSHLCIWVSFDSLVCMRSVCVCTCIW